jgi:hypothetical protein
MSCERGERADCSQPTVRSSPFPRPTIRWANNESMPASAATELPRSNCEERVVEAAISKPARSGTTGPPITTLAWDHASGRAIAGARFEAAATNGFRDPATIPLADQVGDGRRGSSETSTPGPVTSAGARPDVTATICHRAIGGTNIGTPPCGLVMSTSSMRNVVWFHELRNAPSRAGSAGFRPAEKLSLTTGACVVSSVEKRLSVDGRSSNASAGKTDVSGATSRDDCARAKTGVSAARHAAIRKECKGVNWVKGWTADRIVPSMTRRAVPMFDGVCDAGRDRQREVKVRRRALRKPLDARRLRTGSQVDE